MFHQAVYEPLLLRRWNRATGRTGKTPGGYKQRETSQSWQTSYLGPSDLLTDHSKFPSYKVHSKTSSQPTICLGSYLEKISEPFQHSLSAAYLKSDISKRNCAL